MGLFSLFKKTEKQEFDELYLRILQYGRVQLGRGISYNELKAELKREGFEFIDDCDEIAPKTWFMESHIHLNDHNKPCKTLKQFNKNHLDCAMFLRGEHSLKLVQYEASKNALKISKIAAFIAGTALIGNLISVWLPKALQTTEKMSTTNSQVQNQNHQQIQISIVDTVGHVISITPLR